MDQTKKIFNRLWLVVALGAFIYSGFRLFIQHQTYREANVEHERLVALAYPETDAYEVSREIDFEALREINPDMIGWLYVEGADINHPIVQGLDNEHYLTTTFAGLNNPSGAIFVDYRNADDFSDRQTMIYGHNMLNGTMFEPLTRFQNQDFFDQYSTFRIYTPNGILHYEIFSVYLASAYSDTYFMALGTGSFFEYYLAYISSLSLIETGIVPTYTDQIVSLSTCEYEFEDARMIVHGRLIPYP